MGAAASMVVSEAVLRKKLGGNFNKELFDAFASGGNLDAKELAEMLEDIHTTSYEKQRWWVSVLDPTTLIVGEKAGEIEKEPNTRMEKMKFIFKQSVNA